MLAEATRQARQALLLTSPRKPLPHCSRWGTCEATLAVLSVDLIICIYLCIFYLISIADLYCFSCCFTSPAILFRFFQLYYFDFSVHEIYVRFKAILFRFFVHEIYVRFKFVRVLFYFFCMNRWLFYFIFFSRIIYCLPVLNSFKLCFFVNYHCVFFAHILRFVYHSDLFSPSTSNYWLFSTSLQSDACFFILIYICWINIISLITSFSNRSLLV